MKELLKKKLPNNSKKIMIWIYSWKLQQKLALMLKNYLLKQQKYFLMITRKEKNGKV
jgi:hypothetical protein